MPGEWRRGAHLAVVHARVFVSRPLQSQGPVGRLAVVRHPHSVVHRVRVGAHREESWHLRHPQPRHLGVAEVTSLMRGVTL